MMKYLTILLILLAFCVSCAANDNNKSDSNDYWENYLSKEVTISGIAENMKVGAFVSVRNQEGLYIDSLDIWPDGYHRKVVEVKGVVIKKHDLPVFIQKDGQPAISGIPVPEGTDLHAESKRYLLKDSTWKLAE